MSVPQPYDFAQPGRLTSEVEQRVAGWLRAAAALAIKKAARHLPLGIEITFGGLQVQRPADALARLPDPAATGFAVSVQNTSIGSMIVFPRPLALALVGALLGEAGTSLPEDRDLTAVEQDLCEFFAGEVLVVSLQETWPAAEPVPLQLRRREPSPRWSRIFPPDDNVVTCTFHIKAPFGESEWSWLISLKRLVEELARSAPGADKAARPAGPPEPARLRHLIEELPVELTVVLGTVELALADLARLSVGDVVILDQRVSEPLKAHLGGETKCEGWPGRAGTRQAFELASFAGG